jgi:hypothetical protein
METSTLMEASTLTVCDNAKPALSNSGSKTSNEDCRGQLSLCFTTVKALQVCNPRSLFSMLYGSFDQNLCSLRCPKSRHRKTTTDATGNDNGMIRGDGIPAKMSCQELLLLGDVKSIV